MNEENGDKFNQIKDLLGKENNVSDNLKNIISLFGKQNQNQNQNPKEETSTPPKESGNLFDTDTLQMFLKIKQVFDSSRKNDDPREKLLIALKPYLSEKRQDKVGEALMLLKMTNLMNIMTKLEGSEKDAKPK